MEEFLSPQLLKSLHLIFVVTWFAGLFYIVRLFIYHVEAQDKSDLEKTILSNQYKIMQKRLWLIIAWPSMVLTLILANWMLFMYYPGFLQEGWMILKLAFVALLVLYHLGCHKIYKQLQNNTFKFSSTKLRLWNEIATVLLFVIVFLIVYKRLDFYKGLAGVIALIVLLMLGIKWYKKRRVKDEDTKQSEEPSEKTLD